MDISMKNEEKRLFLQAFLTYICPFAEKANAVAIVKAKDGISVEFEFHESNGIITTRRFEEDLIFAHKIAIEAIKEEAKERENWEIHKDEKDPESKIILAIKH